MFLDKRSDDQSRKTRKKRPVDEEIENNERSEDKITSDQFLQACEEKKKDELEKKKLQQSGEQHNKRPSGIDKELVQQKDYDQLRKEHTEMLVELENLKTVEGRKVEDLMKQVMADKIKHFRCIIFAMSHVKIFLLRKF